ncbi:hypothetical protein D3C86_1716770 [compost metagenome]
MEQLVGLAGLDQHIIRQAADHHPFAERDAQAVVVAGVRIGGEEGRRIGIGQGGLAGNPLDVFVTHAARADQGDQLHQLLFHGGESCLCL